ncbi:hypothetical protein ABMA28_001368 [Loxostege sticticalis]|uniref:FLYWCH-type domain-containing protein n=1 Tax=Loxostege sticticalis TaxID=481309 RepID=A0ABD0T1H8_LOXSC
MKSINFVKIMKMYCNTCTPNVFLTAKFIQTKTNRLLMLNSFTFTKRFSKKTGERWCCTKRTTGNCKAYVSLDLNNMIVDLYDTHNHGPPQYHCTKEGLYVRVG